MVFECCLVSFGESAVMDSFDIKSECSELQADNMIYKIWMNFSVL